MSLPTSYLAYSDCFDALEKALEDPIGGRIPVPSEEAAVNLRMRMNYARVLDREKNAGIYDQDHPMHGRSLYDKLVARIRTNGNRVYLYLLHRQALEVEPLTQSEVEDEAADEIAPPPLDKPAPRLQPALPFKRRI